LPFVISLWLCRPFQSWCHRATADNLPLLTL
jgi:hypothetical protein